MIDKAVKQGFVFFVIILFICSGIVSALNVDRTDKSKPLSVEAEKIFDEIKIKLDSMTTKQQALTILNDAIEKLNKYGFLPTGISVKNAQRLLNFCILISGFTQQFPRTSENDSGNTNCLVIGFTNNTFFRPYPSLIMDIPFFYNLTFNSRFINITNYLAFPYVFRIFQPFKLGPYVYFGGRIKHVEYENITDDIYPSSGLIWTYGSNGVKMWNGTFYGSLYTKYEKFQYNNYSSLEIWDPVGINGFFGINFLSIATLNPNIPALYIGFASKVNFTYNPVWN